MVDEVVVEGASPERKKRERSPKRVPVREIGTMPGALILVEWVSEDDWARGFVPREAVVDGTVGEDTLPLATAYGIPWEEFIETDNTPKRIGKALRQRDIWTEEDLRTKQAQVIEAFMSVNMPKVAEILAKIDKRKVGG